MKNLLTTLCLIIAVLLGSMGVSGSADAQSPSQLISSLPGNHQSWVNQTCPKHLGPSLWSFCVKQEVAALQQGIPDLANLSSENKGWINQTCPKHLGPSLWSFCVKQEVAALQQPVTALKKPKRSKQKVGNVAEKEIERLRRENARLKRAEQEKIERLRRENARLKKENQSRPKQVAKRPPPKKTPPQKSVTTGSGFFVSKLGHILTNEHVVRKCGSVTVGDNTKKQVTAFVLETDKRNDLALLRISNMKMTSVETKSLIQKLGIKVVPLATDGLMRAEDVELGEDVLVAGYPYGEIVSNTIKVTKGIVSAVRGWGDDIGQFQIDAAVQPGSSGGPIYDENANIVGMVVAQPNKQKFAKTVGSLPELVNFGIKASTVRQFLNASGLPTKWSRRSKPMSTKELAKIAKSQTVMVVCHQ